MGAMESFTESLNRLRDIHEKEVLSECRVAGRRGRDGRRWVSTGSSHLDGRSKGQGQAEAFPLSPPTFGKPRRQH